MSLSDPSVSFHAHCCCCYKAAKSFHGSVGWCGLRGQTTNDQSIFNSATTDDSTCNTNLIHDRTPRCRADVDPDLELMKKFVRRKKPLTLATGRRSKFFPLEGEDALRREIQRRKNRLSAKRLAEKRKLLENQLEAELVNLEATEKDLLSTIQNLELHKANLELQYWQLVSKQHETASTSSSVFQTSPHSQVSHPDELAHDCDVSIREESYPDSPQWQLAFSI